MKQPSLADFLPLGRAALDELVATVRDMLNGRADDDVLTELYRELSDVETGFPPQVTTAILAGAVLELAKRPVPMAGLG